LNLVGAPADAATRCFAWRARQGRARQHAIFRSYPASATVSQKCGNRLLDRSGADDPGVADFNQGRTFRGRKVIRDNIDGPHLVWRALIGTVKHEKSLTGKVGQAWRAAQAAPDSA